MTLTMHEYIAEMRAQIAKQGTHKSLKKIAHQIKGDMKLHAMRQKCKIEPSQTLEQVLAVFLSDKEWYDFCCELGINDALVSKWYNEFR